MKRLLLTIGILCGTALAQSWVGILAPARATDWTQAGIPGGIPSGSWPNCVTTACNTAFANPTPANVATACAGAPNNTVVRIPAGTFTWNTTMACNRGNVVLRGAGTTQTTITPGAGRNILMGGPGSGGQGSDPAGLAATNWTGGLTRGSTVLAVASTTGLSAGQTVVLDQHNAPWVFTFAVEGECTAGNSCGRNDATNPPNTNPSLQFFGADNRAQHEIVLIHSVDSPTQVTIEAPGISQTYNSGQCTYNDSGGTQHNTTCNPQVFFWNTPKNAQYAGIENMTVNNVNGNDHLLSLPHCDYCWVKNVAVTNNTTRGAIFFFWGYRDEARDFYIGGDPAAGHPQQYGVDLLETTFAKIENGIFFDITSPVMTEGSYGTVLGYNYALNSVTDNQFAAYDTHLAHAYMQLWEGNVGATLTYDNSWGSSSAMTSFRNRISGKDPNKTNYREAMKVGAHSWYVNFVGNVAGDPTYHTQYVCDQAHQQGTDNFVFGLGFWNDCINGIDSSNPYDTVVGSSLMRWGNWDGVTWKANGNTNGIRFCTGAGAGNAACTASETASTDPTFPGLASPATTFPASFYADTVVHAACGTGLSFWKNPSSGFCPPYPPIGPDVTCTINCIANTAAHATKIPAQLCYENTAKDGNGFLTAFDANTCYAPDISANQMIYRPTTFTDTGTNQTGGANPMVNPTFAYDGNPLTSAVGTAVHDGTGQGLWNITYFGFPANTTPNQGGVVLNVTNDWSVAPGGGLGGANLEYSLNGGSTYTTIAADVTHAPTTDSIVLSNTQDFTQVRVHFFSSGCSPANCTQTGHMTEVWISTQVIPSRLQGKGVWSGKGVIK